MELNVLSLFDGMACGRLALDRAGIEVNNYYASEIDPYAIKIAQKNFSDIIQIGDVKNVNIKDLKHITLLIGGSPCQGFSFAGKGLNFEDPRSALFFEYVKILKQLNPKYFLLENVQMKKEYEDIISGYLGVKPIVINSALVSAQNRVRLYWTNIPGIKQPEDKGVLLKDIIENGYVDRDKSYCIDANYYKGGSLKNYLEKKRRQLVFRQSELRLMVKLTSEEYRMLTPIECERLQTLPDGYTEGVSNTQRYKMLGNGWTCNVITHILQNINIAELAKSA
jgi:site-specific DNA-cytosine methylase